MYNETLYDQNLMWKFNLERFKVQEDLRGLRKFNTWVIERNKNVANLSHIIT